MNMNILEFLSERKDIYLDRSFQRKSCWTLAQKRTFLVCALEGRTPYPVVLADIETGLKKSEDEARSASILKYTELKSSDFLFVNLDGQNRIAAFADFFDSKIAISGTLFGLDGKRYPVRNCLYKDLPHRVADAFDGLTINVSIMKNCLYSELHEIFVNINDGQSLNPQEMRNAKMTPISEYVRKFSETEKNESLLLRIWGMDDATIARSLDAEYFAKVFASLIKPNAHYLNRKGLDDFYDIGVGREMESIEQYSSMNRNRFESIIEMVSYAVFSKSDRGTRISQRLFWALVIATSDVYDRGLRILDYVQFFEAVNTSDVELCTETQEQFLKAHKGWLINPKSDSSDEPKRSQYYFHHASDLTTPSVRGKRKVALLERLVKSNVYVDCFKEQSVAAK